MYEAAYDAIKARRAREPGAARRHGGDRLDGRPGTAACRRCASCATLACVDDALAAARRPRVPATSTPLQADGYAHHPYSRTTAPDASDPDPDDVPLADPGRLERPARRSSPHAGGSPPPLPLYVTEYGYESSRRTTRSRRSTATSRPQFMG